MASSSNSTEPCSGPKSPGPSSKSALPKEKWTDEERRQLETKLDEDLDNFIAGLKKRDTEPVPIEQLEQEIANHPFFLKELPKDGTLPPLLQGLQDIKYSEEENTTEDLALAHKEDGNQAFKVANYRLAVMSYTEGINKKCPNKQLNATLYNNRAAAHFRLKNYRSCYKDCKSALEFDPTYTKAVLRLADACMELKLFDECMTALKNLEQLKGKPGECKEVMQKVEKLKAEKARDERRSIFTEKKKKSTVSALVDAIQERGIKLNQTDLDALESPLLGDHIERVHLEDGKLVWPVVLLYPEYKMTEVIQNFHEDSTFEAQLAEVFAERPAWDVENKYNLDKINVYYEDEEQPRKVSMKSTLKSILSKKSYRVEAATPAFIIFVKGSEAESKFLAKN